MLLPDVYVLLVEIFESYLNGFVGFVILFFFFFNGKPDDFYVPVRKKKQEQAENGI